LPVSYFSDIINGQMSVRDWASQAAALGLDAIDLSVLFLRNRMPADLKKMCKDIESAGMSVAVVSAYPDFTAPDAAERKRQLAQLQRDIASIAELGGEMVRVTAGQAHPQTGREQGIAWAIEGLTNSIDTARRYEVKLVYENHSKPGVWDYYDFSHPSDIFLEIAKGIEHTEIGILFDTANPVAYGDDPLPLLEQVIDRVVCVHAADTRTRGALEPVLLGTGLVSFGPIFMKLRRGGYEGWISIEEASGLGEKGVADAVKFVRKTWAEAAGFIS